MIDEKKIEEAAETQLAALGSYGLNEYEIGKIGSMVLYREEDVKESFKAGVSWFLDNLWHGASEEPKVPNGEPCITCLVKFKNASTELCTYWSTSNEWLSNEMCHKDFMRNFESWLYLDDLLKGGK